MNTARKLIAVGLAVGMSALAQAESTVPAEITAITDNASTVWTAVKGIVIGVVGFMILIGFVKMVKKK